MDFIYHLVHKFAIMKNNKNNIMRTNMKILISFLVLLLFIECTSSNENDINSNLAILDSTQEHPEKWIDLQEIADVEYIPLETTDESLISLGVYFDISDKYIITMDHYGPIHFFNREGEYLRTINKYGQGPHEHFNNRYIAVDFDKEEYYVDDRRKIQVYSFNGDWKRTLKMPTNMFHDNLFHYNEKYLITNNRYDDYVHLEKSPIDKMPYYLIDKENGAHTSLPITIENRISRVFEEKIERINKNASVLTSSIVVMSPLLANNNDFLIADYGIDTLYSLKNNKLTPIAVQSPPVHSNNPPTVISPMHYTEQFLTFKFVNMSYIPEYPNQIVDEAPMMMWNRKTNEIFRVKLYDSNLEKKEIKQDMRAQQIEQNNCIIVRYRAESLLEMYEAGYLKGKIKHITSGLKFDDNDVIAIYKLK